MAASKEGIQGSMVPIGSQLKKHCLCPLNMMPVLVKIKLIASFVIN